MDGDNCTDPQLQRRPRDRDQAEFGWGLRPAFQTPLAGQPEVVFPGIDRYQGKYFLKLTSCSRTAAHHVID
jgi:hypothetical protein